MKSDLVLVGCFDALAYKPLRDSLEELGYRLHLSRGAIEAASAVRRLDPRAVLVDVGLPDVNGIQVCCAVKASYQYIPVMAFNRNEPGLGRAALAAGADAVLPDPLDGQAIAAWLKKTSVHDGRPPVMTALFGSAADDIIGTTALLAHDLKSPISIIISTLEVLISLNEDDAGMESMLNLLRGALSAAHRQMNMVNDLLDLARLEIGVYELDCNPVNLVELLRECLEFEASTLTIKRLKTDFELPAQPLMTNVDTVLFQRVFSALVDNVIKFTIHDDLMRIQVRQQDGQVVMLFADTGRPIHPDFEQHIMERAPHWDGRQAGTRTSVAMGLPFVYAVARAHKGNFTAHSDPDTRLTTFTLTVPLYEPGSPHNE